MKKGLEIRKDCDIINLQQDIRVFLKPNDINWKDGCYASKKYGAIK